MYYSNEFYKNLTAYKTASPEDQENILKDLNLLESLIIDRLKTYQRLLQEA